MKRGFSNAIRRVGNAADSRRVRCRTNLRLAMGDHGNVRDFTTYVHNQYGKMSHAVYDRNIPVSLGNISSEFTYVLKMRRFLLELVTPETYSIRHAARSLLALVLL
jgi:hypothetical protein